MRKLFAFILIVLALMSPVYAALTGLDVNVKPNSAAVQDTVTQVTNCVSSMSPIFAMVFEILSLISFLVLAFVMVVLFPVNIGRVSYYCERRPWQSLAWGLSNYLLIIPIILILLISLVGIVLIPVYIIVLSIAMIFGYVSVSQLVGKKVLQFIRAHNKPMILEVALGLLIFALIGFIPVIGGLVKIIAATFGLGAVYVTRFGVYD